MEPYNYRIGVNSSTHEVSYQFESSLPQRPPIGNKGGKAIAIRVNQYKVKDFPTRDIYQYDVSFTHLCILAMC
jgi:eukaryotic translation initiation factor 2C